MKRIRVLRHAKGVRDIKIRPIITTDLTSRQVPIRLARNIRRGHLIRGMRDTSHMGWKSWEQTVVRMQRFQERQLLSKANRFYHALEYS